MDDGLRIWSTGAPDGEYVPIYCGPRDSTETHIVLVPSWAAEMMVERHNTEVEAARANRPTVGDVEGMLTRVLVAALRELLVPRWWRRLRRRH